MEIEQKPLPDAAIRFVSGPLADKVISLQRSVTTIGRDRQNDIVVLDPTVSRSHVRIRWLDDSWIIENLSQRSSLTLEQQRIQQGKLQHQSTVRLGSGIQFIFLLKQPDVPNLEDMKTLALPQRAIAEEQTLPVHLLPPSLAQQIAQAPVAETIMMRPARANVPALIVSGNTLAERQMYDLTSPVVNLGRGTGNEIVINSPIVSVQHAQIIRDGEDYLLIHPHPARGQTLNGLWYQGQHIQGHQQFRKKLAPGDIFRIGDEYGTLITLTYDAGVGTVPETLRELPPIPLHEDKLTIGRTPGNTIVLDHPQVSARHALLEKMARGYRLSDQNSTNHVYVNGERIHQRDLHTGDEVRIGPYRLTYTGTELRQYDESGHVRIEARHLKKVGNNNVILLNDISLVIPPRSFVALVGGSGAGKSTLMDALNGLRPAQEGTVLYNNLDYYHNLAAFSTQLGYVPQDDIVHRDLTVQRALHYAARLRLPDDFTSEQIQWRIDEVLADVEMLERRHLLVSKLSGGQRKRVSIALELLANPSVFFLDEPTSGLDPGLDRKMMTLLRRLADRGRTIVLVTHATNNINSCDYVCFLASGGRMAYFGPPDEARAFFQKSDFSEIYSVLEPGSEHPNVAQESEERFLNSADYQRYVAEPLREYQEQLRQVSATPAGASSGTLVVSQKARMRIKRGKPWSQFLLLSTRYLELLKNDVGNLLILLLQAPVIAVMLVLMARFEVGSGIFDANKLTQCSTSVITASGPLTMPQAQQTGLIDCQHVVTFLKTNLQAQAFVQQKGGIDQALQSFLVLGPGTDAQKVLFIMSFATVLFGCINGTREIVKEAAIYRRERTVNLGILPYMFSKIVVLGLLCLFQSAVLTFVVELGEPLHQGIFLAPMLETYITLALTSLAGLMVGLAISAIAPNNDRAISLVPLVLLPQVIFSGAIIPLKDWFTQIIATIFPTRWAMAALGSSIGLHAETVGGDRLFGNDNTYHSTLFSTYSQNDALHRLLLSWVSLGAIILALIVVIGIFLKRKDVRT
ncbi:MAG TPA: FHA domain-containing protein [Ktedonobacteraceae bacterium]|nr:FHA domain-containing protein [Ktedonobacteraceae bacterium]